MATFRKRGPGRWKVQVRKCGYPNQTKTFGTKAEATAWASAVEGEMVRGVFVSLGDAERTTLSEALVLQSLEARSRSDVSRLAPRILQ